MTTKEQERKALAEIIKIVKGLGEDSYIGTAFEGCFDIAAENIANDWACSMKQRADSAAKDALKADEERRAAVAKAKGAQDYAKGLEQKLENEAKNAQFWHDAAQASNTKLEQAGSEISVTDESGKLLASFCPEKELFLPETAQKYGTMSLISINISGSVSGSPKRTLYSRT